MDFMQIIFWLSLGGTLFSGYINAHRLITKECPFNEDCPEFLGRPACEFGFAMFLAILLTTSAALYGGFDAVSAHTIIYWVGLVGVLFSGFYILREIWMWIRSGFQSYALLFPTCAYGFVFFVLVFVFAFTGWGVSFL